MGFAGFSSRELDVLALLVNGVRPPEIAKRLGFCDQRVYALLKGIYSKGHAGGQRANCVGGIVWAKRTPGDGGASRAALSWDASTTATADQAWQDAGNEDNAERDEDVVN